ncbi:MAG: tRNA (adenosine(37)-N6)-dimethylallyltransferase MiaA [Patescibacteria group bacterium]
MSIPYKIIVIFGPTASGKSELAVKLAKKFNGEIISADSRQIYKGLDIGAGKVPRDKNPKSKILNSKQIKNPKFQVQKQPYFYKGIKHHLLDVISPKQIFTVSQYQKLAKKALNNIIKRGKTPIICGGTGLYINSLIYDYQFPKVPPQPKLRKELEKKSTEKLFRQLKKLDPRRAKNIDKNNRRRLIRALEICITTGEPVPPLNNIRVNPLLQIKSLPAGRQARQSASILKIGIEKSSEELKKGIKKRVNLMIKLGLINETKQLIKKYSLDAPAFASIGYKEIIVYLQNKISLKETIKLIEKNTWQYAKRQMTWFKRDKNIHLIKNDAEAKRLVKKFLR